MGGARGSFAGGVRREECGAAECGECEEEGGGGGGRTRGRRSGGPGQWGADGLGVAASGCARAVVTKENQQNQGQQACCFAPGCNTLGPNKKKTDRCKLV